MGFIGLLLPVGLKLIDWFLTSASAKAEMRRNFLQLVDSLGKEGMITAKLHTQYKQQLARLNKESP